MHCSDNLGPNKEEGHVKKYICIILSMILCLDMASCSLRKASPAPPKKPNEKKEDADKPDKNEGKKLLEQYLRALIIRDSARISSFYSESLKQQAVNFSTQPNPHPNGFTIDSVEEKEGKLQAKVKLLSVYTAEPYFSSDSSSFTIIKEKGSYVIDKIEQEKTTEIVQKENALFMKEGGDVKGKEIIKLAELPGYAVPQGATPDQKYPVGKDRFGPIAGDAEGKKLAVTTVGKYASLMVLEVKDKKVKPLDLYFDVSAQSIAWSQDGNFLAVEVLNAAGTKSVYIYDIEKGKRLDDPVKSIVKPGKYSVDTPYWISENELVFNVSAVQNLTPDEMKTAGSYKLDAKSLSLTKY